ncbi:MAG TPA: family 43 glycosylhydrolase, partial [Candidatus Binatia bacterium]|nr:family 43 glycosylhydrolase [Candidatus Binatia bacterium]
MAGRLRRSLPLIALPLLLAGCWSADNVQPSGGAADFPDPGLLLAPNGRYYRYATQANGKHVPVHSSTSLTGPWTIHPDAFPNPPSWALNNFWGPEVQYIGGYYYLYYAATIAWDGSPFGEHAIGVARSSSPTGPFTAVGPQPLYRDHVHRGAIDPDVVFVGSQQYIIWSTDWGPLGRAGGITRYIEGATMSGPAAAPLNGHGLLASGGAAWERGTVEGPALVAGGDGNWHLFYSGGNYESSYGIGHAIC